MSSWQKGSKNVLLKHRLLWLCSQSPDVWLFLDAGTSLSAVVDNTIINLVATFHMPTLETAGLFNFHCSEVFICQLLGSAL